MKSDELAFVNQQLAGMLRSGIPLEGSLRQLCAGMQRGPMRRELEQLEADLARGIPFAQAIGGRRLPKLYAQMLQAGAKGGDLAGMLTLLADYYQRQHFLGARLKGLMIYPAIVLVAALGLSIFLALLFDTLAGSSLPEFGEFWERQGKTPALGAVRFGLYLPVVFWGAATLAALIGLGIPSFRQWLRWRLPGFKEAGLAMSASAMNLVLQSGRSLDQALGLMEELEKASPAGRDFRLWQNRLADGRGKFSELAEGSRVFPPLFVWLVAQGREDLAAGFRRAAEIYQARATHRMDLLLYAALPVSILFLGGLIIGQIYPVLVLFKNAFEWLGNVNL